VKKEMRKKFNLTSLSKLTRWNFEIILNIKLKNKQDFFYLTNHFCSIDFNYENALSKIYTIASPKSKLSKILLEGALGEVITLTDSNGILN
jgi:hypothetical protein